MITRPELNQGGRVSLRLLACLAALGTCSTIGLYLALRGLDLPALWVTAAGIVIAALIVGGDTGPPV